MPDPNRDLAPIIEPVPPSGVTDGQPLPWELVGAGVVLAVLIALVALWWWHRRAPLRALRQLARLPDPLQAAHELAGWVHRHDLKPDQAWQQDLDRLRFGPPALDAASTLSRLCRQAESFLRIR